MATIEPAVKRVLMSLLKRGAITAKQAAAIGCVSRQAVEKWVAREGWDLAARQDAFALREFERAIGSRVRTSKREMRRQADIASERHEWKAAQDRS